jgi:hypothetical protein
MRGLRPAVNRLIDHFCSERYSACGLPVIDREPPRWAHPNEVPRALDVPVDDPKPEIAMSKARLWRSRSAASIATIGPSTLTYLWRGFSVWAQTQNRPARSNNFPFREARSVVNQISPPACWASSIDA